MLRHLLPSLALATAFAATGASPAVMPTATVLDRSTATATPARPNKAMAHAVPVAARPLGNNLSLHTFATPSGAMVKRISGNGLTGSSVTSAINPRTSRKAAPKDALAGLDESFEGFAAVTDDPLWLPEGWSTISQVEWVSDSFSTYSQWSIGSTDSNPFLPQCADGDYAALINFSTNEKDEWLVTPYVAVGENFHMGYYGYVDPVFLFILDNAHIDWDAFEFISQEVSANVQVLAQPEGEEEWTVLRDYAEEWDGVSLGELFTSSPYGMTYEELSLSQFAGKNVRFAFRYFGTDGNLVMLDKVTVAAPALEVEMSQPLTTLYYGLDYSENWSYLTLPLAIYPVGEPLTWMNYSSNTMAMYLWTYHNPVTNDLDFSFDTDLTVTYAPDYSSAFTRRNNLYYPPVLEGFLEGYSDGKAEMAQTYLQMGGKAEFEIQGEVHPFSILSFDPATQGLTFLTAEPMDFGQPAVPLFGHSGQTKEWWTIHYFGEDHSESDVFEVNSILNFIYPNQNAPMVISGAWVNAMGQVTDEAQFTLEIIALNDEFVQDHVIATATCSGSQVLAAEGGMQSYLTVGFTFDEPVVLDSSCPAYIVKMSGFNSDAVPYFGPMQSYHSHPSMLCHGFVEASITSDGANYETIVPMANFSTDEGECYGAFAINLDACYPWLYCSQESVAVSTGETAVVPLESYYEASQLTVDAPSCYEVSLSGRYNELTMSVTLMCEHETIHQDVITVSGPGCSISVLADQTSTGVCLPSTSVIDPSTETIYNLSGIEVKGDRLPAGVYLRRMSDGSTSKFVVK